MTNKIKQIVVAGLIAIATSSNLMVEAQSRKSTPPESKQIIAGGTQETSPAAQASASFQDRLSAAELLTALQQGGYIIYFRHVETEKEYADQDLADANNCATQRVLNEAGWQQAKAIGKAFKDNSIPVGKIITGEYCRTWQTADLAFGNYEKNSALNPLEEKTERVLASMKEKVMPILSKEPEIGTNTVIVSHSDIFEETTGIYPDPQGVAYILEPTDNGSFEIIANMLPDEWSDLDN